MPDREGAAERPVVFLPGITVPAHVAYAALIDALGGGPTLVTKELEVYRDDRPPPGYRVADEVEGLDRFATERGFDRFHVYGHSLGGAVALAYAARYPDRVMSLALNEPATDFSDDDRAAVAAQTLDDGPEHERPQRFARSLVRPGVELPSPPPGPPSPEMAKRPAGIAAAVATLGLHHVDPDRLRAYPGPVRYSYGALSNVRWEEMARRLPGMLADCTVERFDERHHLDAPHQAEPQRVADALRALWARAERT